MKKTAIVPLVLLCLVFGPAAPLRASGPSLTPVNIATRGTLDDLFFLIARDKKYFEREGIDARLVPIRGGSDASTAAMGAGLVDVMRASLVFSMNDTLRKAGIKMVANMQQAEKGKKSDVYYLVRADLVARVKTYADLRGLRVSIPSLGGMDHLIFLRKLEEAGLKESDIFAKTVPRNMTSILLANKEIDVGYFIEPQAGLMAATGMASVFAGTDISDEDVPHVLLFYSGRFLKNKAAAQGFMNAFLRAVRDYKKMSGEELNTFAVKAWGDSVDVETLKRMCLRSDGEIDTRYILTAQDDALKRGFTTVKLSEKELFDLSFTRNAAGLLDQEERSAEKK